MKAMFQSKNFHFNIERAIPPRVSEGQYRCVYRPTVGPKSYKPISLVLYTSLAICFDTHD